ncbi:MULTISPECIES: sensor histidine kinase KdpD [unclassified Polaribacter]|jgi:two-component system phosphate regulon sensor histidine kinase PhoR|uniref:sensor histidine kinase n=1 Tax=unclassified Polaribacter TaxID=196858 RepID=UPI001C4F45E0|nr:MULTISPECIES: HAMP domain-containing sensor histidine kinase [unclassified Polaribacter]QXP65066.1 HAMP domain-containing histidine kinase [Polaribacter sp. HaHaR_3_91]QXP67560.1 HAMP domain-containing histidine kinase [Polaribacter sp. AHE13PA]
MGKKMFVLIVVLMSISLIGIIAVQLFWINNAVESRNEQFKNDIQKSLGNVTQRINDKEEAFFDKKMEDFFDNVGLANDAQIRNYLFQEIDTITKERFSIGTTYLEENFKLPTEFLDNDSIIVKRVTGKQDFFHSRLIKGVDNAFSSTDENRYSFTKRFKKIENAYNSAYFEDYKKITPLHQRISNNDLNNTIKEELEKRNVYLDFKYGVYSKDGLATKLKSGYYTINKKESYPYPLFFNENGDVEYELYVTFPSKDKHILSGLSGILILSLSFIFIIIIAFSSSLYQLIRQKKISEIKTDFINNMTHEFKTPIATINLALDSIKNPKIINDNEKVLRYVKMIRDENKRMHSQVENVLRISRLEKNQLDISKETIDMHDTIEDAITHVSLLIADRKGTINTHFEAIITEIPGNEFHLTNIIVNILENGLKYSEGAPKINVYTESTNKFFIFKIKDEGIGMSKAVQKQVFDKFYREQKGNIHDVKGHGLGLAYVKEIVEKHHGTVFVESEKGKGSTFTVKLPLI